MKLSEAIRLGSMLKPQTQHALFRSETRVSRLPNNYFQGHEMPVSTCALGAAADAVDLIPKEIYLGGLERLFGEIPRRLRERFPIMLRKISIPREPGITHHCMVESRIMQLNDDLGWTREEIADWVATVEAEADKELLSKLEAEIARRELTVAV